MTGVGLDLVDIERLERAPEVRLSGTAARRAAELGVRARISLTHTRKMAGAVAVLL